MTNHLEQDSSLPNVQAAPRFDLRLVDEPWAFAEQNAKRIAEHWKTETAKNPKLFNGKVLVAVRSGFRADGSFYGDHITVDFDAFLAWRDWGFGVDNGRNIFGSALIRPLEGGFIMGRMGKGTANAGKIYPPSGTLDLKDVAPDGSIDIEASMRRELREETGLNAEDLVAKDAYIIAEPLARICVVRIFETGQPAGETLKQIRANIAADPDPELDDVVHVKHGMAMPEAVYLPYVRAIMAVLA
jgi:hypothetical protein